MDLRDVRLSDRYDLERNPVLLSGTQALVRAALMQAARDKAAGHDTAGYVSGYRGSPLGAVDATFQSAHKQLTEAGVVFETGLNEDLAATAIWGTQQAELRGEGTHDGVFALWYGKGPGVDRSGDVFRHANFAGSSKLGGVLVAMGDDHTCESSTTCHQSELALMDAMMPILSPSGVQELLDYALLGWAMSRYSGAWVGLKSMKDTVEATAVVDGDPHRLQIRMPDDFDMPEEGLNIRLGDTPQAQEARMHDYKRFAAQAFARANNIDHRVHGKPGAKIGIVASGKTWLDMSHAFQLLGLDNDACEQLGITTYKVGMVWPLETSRLREWAQGLDLVIVAEEKRAVIETQLKEVLFGVPGHPRVIGWKDEQGKVLFSVKMGLDPVTIARQTARVLIAEGATNDGLEARLATLDEAARSDNAEEIATRTPWFCAGCPHNTSTKLPDGSRAYAGIGCHYMVQWMDRETEGFTHMGAEGANWIGESHFSKRPHVFQNLGDGTYNHSGILAIRAALAAGTNITYKILFNDAVAMTGGQRNDGGLTAGRIVRELQAMGVNEVVAVADEKEEFDRSEFPSNVRIHERRELIEVEKRLREVEGVSAIVYVQTCAAEKRRRRKRDQFPDPDRRVFINPSVCEGCGDCGVKSNCVAVLPLETPLGRKRQIDQSACNKDFSCLEGFCPSFVTVEGATPKKQAPADFTLPDMPEPALPELDRPWNILITGVGGTGVVTVGALISMAAHLEGKGAGEMQMAGLAQKGGAVSIHCRVAPQPSDITAIRIATGEADAVIGGDLVVTGNAKVLGTMTRGRTGLVCNSHEIVTGEFTRNAEFRLPTDRLGLAIRARVGDERAKFFDATRLAEAMLGDAIYANVLMLGAAWQAGLVPISREALQKAIELNRAGVEGNLKAFEIGRWAVIDPAAAAAAIMPAETPAEESFAEAVARREAHLTGYQNARLAKRYRKLVDRAADAEQRLGLEGLSHAVAEGYFKLLSYKDEYEVARLHVQTLEGELERAFEGTRRISFHMAPPIFGRKNADGTPRKSQFGPWMFRALKFLAKLKGLRGTPLDIFGYSRERKWERGLIRDYERVMDEVLTNVTADTFEIAEEIARVPLQIRGFGHIKEANGARAAEREAELLAAFRAGGTPAARAAE